MAIYRLYGSLTYTSTANATTAFNNMSSSLATFPTVVASSSTSHPPGIVRSSLVVTLSFDCPDEATATACAAALRAIWPASARTIHYVSITRIG